MYQYLYSRFLKANPGKQHFACHSHYYWPDASRDAHIQYWDDSALYADKKWEFFFSECVPDLQSHIATILNAPDPQQCVFAPNTHELLFRILSCLDFSKPVRILTTDSEFPSVTRQVARLEEQENVQVERIATQPFSSFQQRFEHACNAERYDLVFISQVFFNSGVAVEDIDAIVEAAAHPDTIVVVDGYHGFMAVPTDISRISQSAFYLAGGYKYAQGGEGGCFAVVPQNCELRPAYTGWYAEFGELSAEKAGRVSYSKNGMRFAGATMDYSPLYRMRAVFNEFGSAGLNVDKINRYIKTCQSAFLKNVDAQKHELLNSDALLVHNLETHGHFLTFELPTAEDARSLSLFLEEYGILTDYRGSRLRFGFALYHNPDEYDFSCLQSPLGTR
jgi:selenocysteine lyase/cysteine desulfurase